MPDRPPPRLADFSVGRTSDERLVDLLAFALATERNLSATPENLTKLRGDAGAALSDYAFRLLHNRVEEIRQTAVAERMGVLRRPPGLFKLIFANLLALAVVGAAGVYVWLHPAVLNPALELINR